jgi:anti-sigma B factor antagonist
MAHDPILVWGEQPGVAVVLLSGEQEAYSAPKLEAQLAPLVEEGIGVVVDLSPTTFVDSATLLVLLKARKRAEERRVGFALQMGDSTGASVRRTFELTRLDSIFRISRTRAEAIEIARAGRSADPGLEPA